MLLQLFDSPITLASFLLAIVIGLTVHEFAHAWMANRLGDYTAKYAGRLSLNPSRHFDLTGTIFLLFVGFGWGKPVPINPNALHGRYDQFKVAIAGPISNILVAAIFSIPIYVALAFDITFSSSLTLSILQIIVEVNLLLAAFNILPIYPLDGSKILRPIFPIRYWHHIDSIERSGYLILFAVLFLEYIMHINIIFPIIVYISKAFSFVIASVLEPFGSLIHFLFSLF